MGLEKKPFVSYDLEENKKSKADVVTLWLNKEERLMLNQAKKLLQQPKDSTCMKQLAGLGANLLGDNLTGQVISTVFKNKRKNSRLGIIEVE